MSQFTWLLLMLPAVLITNVKGIRCGEGKYCLCEQKTITCEGLEADLILDKIPPQVLQHHKYLVLTDLDCGKYSEAESYVYGYNLEVVIPDRCESYQYDNADDVGKDKSESNNWTNDYGFIIGIVGCVIALISLGGTCILIVRKKCNNSNQVKYMTVYIY